MNSWVKILLIEQFQDCCKFPSLEDPAVEAKVMEQFKDNKETGFVVECVRKWKLVLSTYELLF